MRLTGLRAVGQPRLNFIMTKILNICFFLIFPTNLNFVKAWGGLKKWLILCMTVLIGCVQGGGRGSKITKILRMNSMDAPTPSLFFTKACHHPKGPHFNPILIEVARILIETFLSEYKHATKNENNSRNLYQYGAEMWTLGQNVDPSCDNSVKEGRPPINSYIS